MFSVGSDIIPIQNSSPEKETLLVDITEMFSTCGHVCIEGGTQVSYQRCFLLSWLYSQVPGDDSASGLYHPFLLPVSLDRKFLLPICFGRLIA